MKKSQIIILILAGGISFVSVFSVSWLFTRKSAATDASEGPTEQASSQDVADTASLLPADVSRATDFRAIGGMSEQQLRDLIKDIRNKATEYKSRQKDLDIKAERIEITSRSLQEDIDRLNELRDKLSRIMSEIDQKQQQLEQSIIEIESIEQNNFKRLASTYDKMDATQASRIMINMASSNQLKDSVKILYYMSERTAGSLLAEIANNKPELASLICMQLKFVKEGA